MPRYLLVVLSNPVDGKESEFYDWYDNSHLPELLALPGVLSAKRFTLADDSYSKSDHQCLVVYELDFESPEVAWAAFDEGRAQGQIDPGDSMDRSTTRAWFFAPVAP